MRRLQEAPHGFTGVGVVPSSRGSTARHRRVPNAAGQCGSVESVERVCQIGLRARQQVTLDLISFDPFISRRSPAKSDI